MRPFPFPIVSDWAVTGFKFQIDPNLDGIDSAVPNPQRSQARLLATWIEPLHVSDQSGNQSYQHPLP